MKKSFAFVVLRDFLIPLDGETDPCLLDEYIRQPFIWNNMNIIKWENWICNKNKYIILFNNKWGLRQRPLNI